MTQSTALDAAVRAATRPLTEEQRRLFDDDMRRLFPDDSSTTPIDLAAARERAWNVACSKLLSDPLDPVGEAWSRVARSLVAG